MSRRKKRKTQEEKDRSTQFSIPKVFSTAQTPTEIHIIGLGREGAEFSLIEFTLIKFIYSLNFSRASFFYSLVIFLHIVFFLQCFPLFLLLFLIPILIPILFLSVHKVYIT